MPANPLTLESMPWWTYVETVTDKATNAAIGLKVGVTGSSVGRWMTGSLPDPGTAARFAREYGRPVLEAFVAAGFLTPEEARQRPSQRHPITAYDDQELVDEVSRRFKELRERSESHVPRGREKSAGGTEAAIVTGAPDVLMPPEESPPAHAPLPAQSGRGSGRGQ